MNCQSNDDILIDESEFSDFFFFISELIYDILTGRRKILVQLL